MSVADGAVVWAQTDEGIRGFLVPPVIAGFSAPEIKRVLHHHVSVGKLADVRAALEVARSARTLLGANGISLEYPVMSKVSVQPPRVRRVRASRSKPRSALVLSLPAVP